MSGSNPYLLVLVKRNLVASPVIELRGARRGMIRHLLRMLECSVMLQVGGDAGRAHHMVADERFDSRRFCTSADHAKGVLLCHAMHKAGLASARAPEGSVAIRRSAEPRMSLDIFLRRTSGVFYVAKE